MKDATISSALRAPASRGKRSGRKAVFQSDSELSSMIRANTPLLTFAGLTLGVFLSRRFFVLPLAALAMILQEGAKSYWEGTFRGRKR